MSDELPDNPHDFFTAIVPERFGEVGKGIAQGPGSVCFDILGHGQWSLEIIEEQVKVTDGRNDDTLVHISLDGAEWQAAVRRITEGGSGPLSSDGLSNMMSNPAMASTLKAAQGTLKLVTQTDGGDSWVAVTFGGAEPNLDAPRATLSMSSEVAEQMAAGEANPQELFMSGKIQITGDMMMLMQLAPVLS